MNIQKACRNWLSVFSISAFALSVVAMSGCGDGNDNANNATNTATNATSSTRSALKVALLTPGDINDKGWNQLAYEGLQGLEKGGMETSHQVTKKSADWQPALRDFGDKKYDLVFCHGYEFGANVKEIAKSYPDTKFVVVSGDVTQAPNVVSMIPQLEEATYLLGMAAGSLTKTNVIGLIGGTKVPVVTSTFIAFEQGVKATNPKAKIIINYIGNWEDQNAAKESTRQMIAQGADVFFHNADQAGNGMFQAAQEAKGVLVFGSNRNQNGVAPTICVASAVIEMPRAFAQAAKSVQDKTFQPQDIALNMRNNNISVQWNDALKSKVPAATMKKIDDAQAQIKAGKLKIKRNV